MKYCTNCGHELHKQAKFCPSCGYKLQATSDKNQPKMHKRESKSLKDRIIDNGKEKTQKFVKEKTQEYVKETFSNSKPCQSTAATNQNYAPTNLDKERSKKVKKWMLYYILVNIPLYFVNTGDDEILGVLIFSTAVLVGYAIYSFQKKKDKPYTLVLKIVLILQGLLAVSGIMMRLEFLDSGTSLVAVISLAILVFLNLRIIFRKNK